MAETLSEHIVGRSTFPEELRSLRDKLNEIALADTLEGPHAKPGATLYHFTTQEAMEGILKSGTLWATCLSCLEDKGELEYPLHRCRKYLERRRMEGSVARKHFIEDAISLEEEATKIMHCLEQQAPASFSKKPDVRSQWEKYADSGRGITLGFDSHGLLGVVASQTRDPNSTTEINWLPRTMVYDPSRQGRLLGDLLDRVFACSQFARPCSTRIYNGLVALALYSFGNAAAAFKRKEFSMEHEVRLAIANHRELALAETALPKKQRFHRNRIVEYIEIDLRHHDAHVMPLKEIIIGPDADYGKALEIVRLAIERSCHVGRCEVRRMTWNDMR